MDVMYANMHFWATKAEHAVEKLVIAMSNRNAKPKELLQAWRIHETARAKAQTCAAELAPYVHPKLSAIKVRVSGVEDLRLLPDDELVAALATLPEEDFLGEEDQEEAIRR